MKQQADKKRKKVEIRWQGDVEYERFDVQRKADKKTSRLIC